MNAKLGRASTYAVGLVVLALGITLNTKTGLGTAPLVSISYVVSQLPFALVFTRFMGLFDRVLPNLAADCAGTFWGTMGGRLVALAVAILLIGIGACLSVRMRLIPNPGDGIVLTISDVTGWKLGLTKNVFDLTNVAIACLIGLIARGRIIGVGVGTALCMLGVGRVIDLTGRLLAPMIERLAPKPE